MVHKTQILFALLYIQFAGLVNAKTFTLEELLVIGPFSLESPSPSRIEIESNFGKGKSQVQGRGGEKTNGYCYSINKLASQKNIINTITLFYDSPQKQAFLNGFLIEAQHKKCPEILTVKEKSNLAQSSVFLLAKMSKAELYAALPIRADSAPIDSSVNIITREYTSTKIIKHTSGAHSPEIAYRIHGNNFADYAIDTSASLRVNYKEGNFKSLSIFYRTTY
jgi:hypothetical protein